MDIFHTKQEDGSIIPAVAFTTANPTLDAGDIVIIPPFEDETYDIGLRGKATKDREYWCCCEIYQMNDEKSDDEFKAFHIEKILADGFICGDTTFITLYDVMSLTTLAFCPTRKYRLKFEIPQLTERETFPDGWIPQDTFDLYFDGKVFYNSGFYEQYEDGSLKYTYNPYTKSRSDQTNIGDYSLKDMDIIAVYDEKQEILYIEYDDD